MGRRKRDREDRFQELLEKLQRVAEQLHKEGWDYFFSMYHPDSDMTFFLAQSGYDLVHTAILTAHTVKQMGLALHEIECENIEKEEGETPLDDDFSDDDTDDDLYPEDDGPPPAA